MDDDIVRIENWSVVGNANPYTAPELRRLNLNGDVYGHPDYPDGKNVTTSYVMDADGVIITCRSRKYRLGEPKAGYLKYLKDSGIEYNAENPIKIHKR